MGWNGSYQQDPHDAWVFFAAGDDEVETLLEPVAEENPDAHRIGFTSIRLDRGEDGSIEEAVICDGVYSRNPFKPLLTTDPPPALLEAYDGDRDEDVVAVNLGAYRERQYNLEERTYKGFNRDGFYTRLAAVLDEPVPVLTEEDRAPRQQVPA